MTLVEAWSAVVAGEDAAVYAYSVAGARVHAGARQRALRALDDHRANRSRAASIVVAAAGTPPPSAASYDLPFDVTDAVSARGLMAYVENGLVGAYADAAAAAPTADVNRRWAARTGAECATRAVVWAAAPQAFPVAQD